MRFFSPISLAIAATTTRIAAYVPGRSFDRFITIWLGTQDFAGVSNNAHMESIYKEGVTLENYWSLTHPSQPNYIASIGGDYFGLNHDDFVTIPLNVSTVVDLLDTKNIEWKGYFEGSPGPGYMGLGSTALDGKGWDYVRRHNPFVSYNSINRNSTRLAQLQSFREFDADVAANRLPQYAFLSPNLLNNGDNTTLEYAASWTETFLIPLLQNDNVMNNTLILLTSDQSATSSSQNMVTGLLLGGIVPADQKGTSDPRFYSPYSILSTIESNWELPCLGRYDVGANVFELVTYETGYTNHAPSNMKTVNNSVSYPGFLNSDPALFRPIPQPNLKLIGAGGFGVDDSTNTTWGKRVKDPTPYEGTNRANDGGPSEANAVVYSPQGPATPKYAVTPKLPGVSAIPRALSK